MKKKTKKGKHKIKVVFDPKATLINLIYFMFGIFTMVAVLTINTHAFNIGEYFKNTLSTSLYNGFAVSNLDDNITILVSNFCKPFNGEEQVNCVINQVAPLYNYVMHNTTMRTPTETIQEGGVCRDASVMYAAIFQRLGWFVSFNYPTPNHVNIVARKDYKVGNVTKYLNCLIDQTIYRCDTY